MLQTSNTPGIFLSHYDVEEARFADDSLQLTLQILELGDAPPLAPSVLKTAMNVEWVCSRICRPG